MTILHVDRTAIWLQSPMSYHSYLVVKDPARYESADRRPSYLSAD